jgi:hypothetical protein
VQIAARVVKRLKKRRADILFPSAANANAAAATTTTAADFHPVKISALLHELAPFIFHGPLGDFETFLART